MDSDGPNEVDRRRFLKQAGLAVGATALAARGGVAGNAALRGATRVSVVIDPADPVASAAPAKWAVDQLRQALAARRIECRLHRQIGEVAAGDLCIEVAGHRSTLPGGIVVPDAPEALAIATGKRGDKTVLFAYGADVRGLVYALTELADISIHSDDPLLGLRSAEPIAERPGNPVRSCMRMFSSDIEDKAWFNDREFWKSYLSMLIAQRFNRFNLCFGLAYDFTREIRDAYLHFAYPFLVKVPGYEVRATNLSAAERDRNLEMLRFISDEAAGRGLHFQLGLWTHAYEWTESPEANHRIEGLRAETHATYCRDALAILLRECPSIAGVTIRTHGESGVGEGNYELWRQVFDGVVRSGRRLEIDLHAKGLDRTMIETALATGLPVTLSPKFWAEHMGLPYHQAWIRPHRAATARARRRAVCAERGLTQLPQVWLRRSARREPPLRHPPSRLARHPAVAALGRPRLRGGLRPRSEFLREPRRRGHGAAVLQRSQGLGPGGPPHRVGGPIASAAIRFREVPLHVPTLGPAAVQPRDTPRGVAAAAA